MKGLWKSGKFMNGSYTVEAAAVVSLTVLVLGALIICSFYLHDRVVLQGAACEAAAVGSSFASDSERSAALAAAGKRITANRLLGSRNVSSSTSAGSGGVTASWEAIYPVPGFAMKYLTGNRIEISQSWSCKVSDPADTIRKIRGIGDLLTGGDS